ncbi:probably inactive receptor-like protein kinase At2g46850 isoform X1 [Arachis ipaensis]|uniref:probably inactive receptor-like protein kinase At2g46850 isoform X1 n=1 Tax=Arachis ipaensis TaxID=130454 RepID=UPI000A2B26A1|nr:probably inactive receptor-like protein kinase At2g46850 isoform X1 [Arachis ipaensis]XP_025631867.1 probably inactive receptor-like protein kinase At2g46850 isoform X1 [Arachis hypogaea]QHO22644.1 putative inactive receptor-like protein kinase [Arachis hypogaea]
MMHIIIGLELLVFLPFSCSLQPPNLLPNPCNETCGKLHVPFPFFVNSSCASISTSFNLSCSNSSNLFLKIDSQSYKVLEFFNDGLLVDFPAGASSSSTCRMYNDLNSFGKSFEGKDEDQYGISLDNVVGLYDCDDSSVCKPDCETIELPGCDGSGNNLGCCYPLSDHSIWHSGEGFSVFSEFGCRGFSSWAVVRGSNSGKHGVKLEWGVPLKKNSSSMEKVCDFNAEMVNASSVQGAVRCVCQDGFLGDGFLNGSGCLQSCMKNGQEAYGDNCYIKKHDQRKMLIIVGILGPFLIVASLITLFYLLKKPATKPGMFDTEQAYYHSISFRKPNRTRLFSHHDLDKATKGFEEGQKLMSGAAGSIFAGVLGDGSHIAVQKLKCENEKDIIQVVSQIEILSNIVHRNMACVLGCCIESSYTPLVVYEYPANGTLEEHLNHEFKGNNGIGLDWYRRLIIATETAYILAFLHYENSPPIFHNNLKSSCIFLDDDLSVKIAGFGLLNSKFKYESHHFCKNDVYDMGLLLLEIISGSNSTHQKSPPTSALEKIRDGKLEEIVDPLLSYHEMAQLRRDQVQIVADLATRCMLFGGDGKIGMVDVVRELVHITKQSGDAGNLNFLEETFSNSSLLQMISMSPDSIIVH